MGKYKKMWILLRQCLSNCKKNNFAHQMDINQDVLKIMANLESDILLGVDENGED